MTIDRQENTVSIERLTPAEIDQLWLEATAPSRKLREQANEQSLTAAKYERAGGKYRAQAERYRASATELHQKATAQYTEASAPFQAEWDVRHGWTRAYVVPDGHIHRTTSCHTLYPTTVIAWLPELSGQTEDEIVAAAGVHACTVCYPTAPVEALRAAEAAAKAASECPGSRTYDIVEGTWHRTSHTGSGRGKCQHCGEVIGTSTTGKLRAHPRAKVEA